LRISGPIVNIQLSAKNLYLRRNGEVQIQIGVGCAAIDPRFGRMPPPTATRDTFSVVPTFLRR
jgi:hypothetical protein